MSLQDSDKDITMNDAVLPDDNTIYCAPGISVREQPVFLFPEWIPINEDARDGSWRIISYQGQRARASYYDQRKEQWMDDYGDHYDNPSHWFPMPELP